MRTGFDRPRDWAAAQKRQFVHALRAARGWAASHKLLLAVVSGAVALAVALVLALVVLPELFVEDSDGLTDAQLLKARNDVRTTLVQALGGAFLLAGLYFTARTYLLNQEGQVTERFTRAIEQLGSDKPDVSLGGIYGLERLARSSQREHWQIMQVLAAYVRIHAAWRDEELVETDSSPADEAEAAKAAEVAAEEDSSAEEESSDEDEPSDEQVVAQLPPRPVAIQAALTALVNRRVELDQPGQRLDLSNADLRDYLMHGIHLEYAWLEGTHLDGARLDGAKLSRAYLGGASLVGTHLEKATLDDAVLDDAVLSGAILDGAKLRNTKFRRAHLESADLIDVEARGANFLKAHLEGANFASADAVGASFFGAWLREANFFRAHLSWMWFGRTHDRDKADFDAVVWYDKSGRVFEPGARPTGGTPTTSD